MLGKEFIFYGNVSMSDTNTYMEYGVHMSILLS